MKRLRSDWLTAHWNDEELPRYEFLDYLQGLHKEMDAGRLFPMWEDAYLEYARMKSTAEALERANRLTPGSVQGIDPSTLRLMRIPDQHVAGYAAIEQARSRIGFARPLLKRAMQRSERLRRDWLNEIELSLIGLELPNRREGILLLRAQGSDTISGWVYRCGIQRHPKYPYSALQLTPCGLYEYSISNTLVAIRDNCKKIAGWEGLPVNTWMAEAKTPMPVFSTLKPLAVMRLSDELAV